MLLHKRSAPRITWWSRKIPIFCCTPKTCSCCMIFCNSSLHLHRFIAVNLWLKYVQYFVHAPTWECDRGEGAGHRLRPIYGRWLWHIGHVQPTTQLCTSFRRWCGIKGISSWIFVCHVNHIGVEAVATNIAYIAPKLKYTDFGSLTKSILFW